MRKLEKVLVILIALAILGKTVPISGSSIILTFATLTLAFLYFPLGFALFTKIGFRNIFKRDSYTGLKPWDIIISILTGIAFQTLVLGILFKLNYWAGATFINRAGLFSILFIIPAIPLLLSKNRFVYVEILKRGIPIFLFALLLQLLPVTTRLKIFKVDKRIEVEILKTYRNN